MKELRSAFTLIELLVVVAVIAILAALLMPALGKAREAAKKATCAGNQKQLGAVSVSYGNDYEEFTPNYVYYPGTYTSVYWYELLGRYLGWKSCGTQALYRSGGRAKPVTAPSIFMCPSGKWGGNKDNFFYQSVSYQCNVPYVNDSQEPTSSNRGAKVSQVIRPSLRFFLFDTGVYNFYLPGTGKTPGCTTSPTHVYVTYWPEDFYNGRHVRSINGVFFDGHVENMASDTAWRHRSLGGNSTVSVFNIFK